MQALRVEAKSRPASQDMKEGFGHTVTCGKAVCQLFGGALLEVHVHQRRAEARVSRRMWVGGLGIQKVGWGYNRWVGDTREEQRHEGISVVWRRQSPGVKKNRGWE